MFSLCTLTTASCSWLFLFTSCFLFPYLTPSGFFNRMLGVFEPGSTELLHFISSHPIDLICIQESNLNLSSYFRISGFSALRSDRSHSRSDIFCTDVTDTSGGVSNFFSSCILSSSRNLFILGDFNCHHPL